MLFPKALSVLLVTSAVLKQKRIRRVPVGNRTLLFLNHQSVVPYCGCYGWVVTRLSQGIGVSEWTALWSADCVCRGLQVLPLPTCCCLILLLRGYFTLMAGLVFHVVFDAGLALITFPPKEFEPRLWPHVSPLSRVCLASVKTFLLSCIDSNI